MLRLLSLAALAILVVCVAACGATERTTTVTVASSSPRPVKPASSKRKPKPKVKRAARAAQATPAAPAAPKPIARTACDQNITAKVGTTSCPFALNVFWAFWHAREAGQSKFVAYSPVADRDYDMECTTAATVTCRAGDGAEVRFPLAAVKAYTPEAADAYAATHETGAAPKPAPAPRAPSGGNSTTDCDPNYEGPCLDANAYDYDCEGGDGDGPEYTGPVRIVGDDPYGLDRDGDGVACEPY